MRKTAIFATFVGLAATSAFATYHIMRLLDERKKKEAAQDSCETADPIVEVETKEEEGFEEAVSATVEAESEPKGEPFEEKEVHDDGADLDLCYYLPQSKVWHSDETCAFIAGKSGVVTSTVAKANAAGKMRGCSRCGA